MTILADQVDAVVGVDTHEETHTAAAVSAGTGAVLETCTVTADPDGYHELVEFADVQRGLRVFAIEGTGSYGAGLTRYLQDLGEVVVEVERPNRPARRGGKSDEIDAVRGAREALSAEHLAQPRSGGTRAALAVTLVARRSAIDAVCVAQRQLRALIITAPEPLRARFRGRTTTEMATTAARLRCHTDWDTHTRATATALKTLGRRAKTLSTEADSHERALDELVRSWRPDLLALCGVGPIVAATVLCAWSHPGRCRNEAAFASLAGVAPLDASSGKHQTHRLNRSGDRQLNRVIHTIMLCRLRYDPDTRAYAERRQADNKPDRHIKRCLKRYIARQLYRQLENPPATTT